MNRFSRGVYDWLDQRIDMALGCLVDPVKDIDTHRHQICLNDGSKVAYDKLLLATGRFGHTTIKDFLIATVLRTKPKILDLDREWYCRTAICGRSAAIIPILS